MRLAKLLSTFFLIAATCCAAQAAEEKDTVTLAFDGADIRSVIKTVGMITGKNFILDPRVTGTINIISANPVQRDLVYPILLSALRMQGFTAIEGTNGVVKVLPEADAKLTYSPTGSKARGGGDRIVTQVYTLKHESAVQLVPVLRPLIAPNNVINAYPNSNTLVITDYAENLRRIDKIISSIDIASSAEIELIKLEHASAQDISQLLARLMPEASAPAAVPGGLPKLVFAVDSRTNGLIVRADSAATILKVKQLVADMDIPSAEGGNIRVIYLRNAEAAKVAETLRGILGASSGGGGNAVVSTPQPVPVQPGQPAAAAAPVPSISIPASSGGGSIQAHPSTNSLVITAPDFVYNSLRTVIEKLDARRAQVFIEALIAEVSTDQAAEFGIQWQDLSGAADNNLTAIGGTNFNTAGRGNNIIGAAGNLASVGSGLNIGVVKGRISIPGVGEVLNLGMLARALESKADTNILSTPNLLTVDNEEAKIVVGQNVPFVTGSFSQTQTTGAGVNPFQTIERRDVGLTLRVTPQVSEGGTIKLKIFQEVSSLTGSAVSTADVVTNKRSIESTVLVDDQQTVVLGGLIQDDVQNRRDQVPGLGNIPVVGNLFKYETRQRKKTNLMVFLRPVILRDNLSPGPITNERYDYIRNEQLKAKLPEHWLLPDVESPRLPERDPLFGPRAAAAIKPIEANTQQTPKAADPSPLSMSRRLGGRREPPASAAGTNPATSSQPREVLPGSANTTGAFSDNLMLTPPAKTTPAKRSTKDKR